MALKAKLENRSYRREALGDLAYRRLRDGMRGGEYPPGERLREADVAKSLNISRTPVREALRRLEAEGLLSYDTRGGLIVTKVDQEMILELYAMREMLEGAASRLAARHASDIEIEVLRRLVREEGELPDDPAKRDEYNFRFHQAVYRSAHNRYLLRVLSTLHDAMMLAAFSIAFGRRAEISRKEHRKIVEAIGRRDPDAAEQAAREHIRRALQARLTGMGEQLLEDSAR
jgi:DNA-binding GntR family transcriptional regulator